MAPDPVRRGLMLVLSSPSGAGKTTVSRRLLAAEGDLAMSVSVTTRPKRPGERDGTDYLFVDDDTFSQMVRDEAFLEHASVFGYRYGTPRTEVEQHLARGRDVLFDIDWQGTQQLRQRMPGDLVTVFILPPSLEELERRLRERKQDADEVVRERMARAAEEMSYWAEYDYVLVNDDLEPAVAAASTILAAERLRRPRHPGLAAVVSGILDMG